MDTHGYILDSMFVTIYKGGIQQILKMFQIYWIPKNSTTVAPDSYLEVCKLASRSTATSHNAAVFKGSVKVCK